MTNDLVQDFYDVYHTHNLEHLRMILTSSYVGQVNGRDIVGIEAAQAFLQAFLTAFPDVRYDLHDRLDVGEKVVIRWSATATHRGDFAGIVATNKRVTMSGITIFLIEAGRIGALWNSWDIWSLVQQLRT